MVDIFTVFYVKLYANKGFQLDSIRIASVLILQIMIFNLRNVFTPKRGYCYLPNPIKGIQ